MTNRFPAPVIEGQTGREDGEDRQKGPQGEETFPWIAGQEVNDDNISTFVSKHCRNVN